MRRVGATEQMALDVSRGSVRMCVGGGGGWLVGCWVDGGDRRGKGKGKGAGDKGWGCGLGM